MHKPTFSKGRANMKIILRYSIILEHFFMSGHRWNISNVANIRKHDIDGSNVIKKNYKQKLHQVKDLTLLPQNYCCVTHILANSCQTPSCSWKSVFLLKWNYAESWCLEINVLVEIKCRIFECPSIIIEERSNNGHKYSQLLRLWHIRVQL